MPEITTPWGSIPFTRRHRRRRSVTLTVSPEGSVTVWAPRWVLPGWLERFVRKNAEWVHRQRERSFERQRLFPARQFVGGEMFWVHGQEIPLELHSGFTAAVTVTDRLVVTLPDPTDRVAIRTLLQEWYLLETKQRVEAAIALWATRLGLTPVRVAYGDAKTRWGSCSAKGRLRFSWKLSMMPDEILEYIVIHELAHLRAHDHSPRFWSVVAEALPEYRLRRSWLRVHAPSFRF